MITRKQEDQLERIAADMEANRKNSASDPENGHTNADELLCEALRVIGGGHIANIIEAFNQTRKWYA